MGGGQTLDDVAGFGAEIEEDRSRIKVRHFHPYHYPNNLHYHICPIYVPDMAQICFLPRERCNELSIFKGQSNISVSPALQPTNAQRKKPLKKWTFRIGYITKTLHWMILLSFCNGPTKHPNKEPLQIIFNLLID